MRRVKESSFVKEELMSETVIQCMKKRGNNKMKSKTN